MVPEGQMPEGHVTVTVDGPDRADDAEVADAQIVDAQIVDALYTVRINALVVDFHIGIHAHEQGVRQRVQVDIAVDVVRPEEGFREDYARVYCYERIVKAVRALASGGHVRLVETLADRVAEIALADDRARRAEVTVSKLDVFHDADSVGVTVVRRRLS